MTTDWRKRLNAVRDAAGVVGVAREFLAEWSPEQLAALPESCRPGPMSNAQDLNAYAYTLVHAQCNDSRNAAELEAIATFFALANARLALILGRPQGDAARLFITK